MTIFCTDKTRVQGSDLDRVFCKSHCIDVLLYIHDNPGCGKKDLYQAIGRSNSVSDRLTELVKEGLVLETGKDRRIQSYSLTRNGSIIAGILLEAETIMETLI